ncbi:hypothetical protein J437_LFUL007228, partial [Ladona fulva]
MENYEELLIVLEEFERSKPKEIPKELDDFIGVVAKTGNIVYPWAKLKSVYRSKIMSVLSQFFETFPNADISQFSFESMKTKILERFDQFISAPFTIQRLSELLINPRKEYNRIDKYMRAIEKNILVVSGVEPGCLRQTHLNGGVEMMEEGFQVSSTSVTEECKDRVEGEESTVDNQENHHMEFLSAETDASAVPENVSEEISKPDVSDKAEEPGKECSEENTSMNASASEGNESSDGPVISEIESCDTVAEVEAIASSVPVEEDMAAPADKSIETDEKVEEDMSMDTSPPKEESLPDDSNVEAKADSQNVDVIDVGSSMEVHSKTESDSEIPTKVLILSSPKESPFEESTSCSNLSESEVTVKSKEEPSNIEPDQILSASEKLVEEESDDSHTVTPDSNETSEDSNVEPITAPEPESPARATSP